MAGAESDAVAARLALLEARPALERDAAAQLRGIVQRLEAASVAEERYEGQKLCAMLLRAAGKLEKWARSDQRRVASVHAGIRARSSPSAAARAAVDAAMRDALGDGGPTPDGGSPT